MGQNQTGHTNPMLEDWHPHPHHANIFVNAKTNEEAQSHLVILKKNEEPVLRKRMQQHHNFVVKILYYQPADKQKIPKDESKFIVYTERLLPLSQNMWVPVTSALSILKGFRRLSSSYGMFRITPNMIKVNNKKDIEVWITQNPVKSEPISRADSEQQMLADIVKIIMEFDSQTGSLMVKCFTLNEAINSILHNITQNKSVLHFSSRTNKKEDKQKNIAKQPALGNKNPFRSTKETEDDSIKPFTDSGLKYTGRKQTSHHMQTQGPANYLYNVNVQKSPTYINPDEVDSPKKFQSPAFRKLTNEVSAQNNFNFTQPNTAAQKQSSIQFNNSQPGKVTPVVRSYKPIEHKNQNFTESMYNYNVMQGQLSPSHQKLVNKDSIKFKQGIYKSPNLVNYQPQRKSNISKNFLERGDKMDVSQDSDLQNDSKVGKGSLHMNTNQKSQINTSRQFMGGQVQSLITKHPMSNENHGAGFIDSNRTKTQQFYASSHDFGYSPRIRTNYIHTNHQTSKLPIAQSGINSIKKPQPQTNLPGSHFAQRKIEEFVQIPRYKSQFEDSKDKNQSNSVAHQEQKKIMKLKQAQKIKEQMGCLGIVGNMNPNSSSLSNKPLLNDKSARDLLIKQKVEQKNKKHEQLKSAITRLLND